MSPDPARVPTQFLTHLFEQAVREALPQQRLAACLPPPPRGRTVVLGAGKAACAMADAVEAAWPPGAPLLGLVIARYGHSPPRAADRPPRIERVEAGHPVPDAAGLAAAQRMLALARGLTADDLVLCLFSGGGSALLALPVPGLALETLQRITRQLLGSGARIDEINCVRKHLSQIAGGRLAAACAPARVVTLALSDVPGDDPSVIASGPTVPDPTRCADALAILRRDGIALPAEIARQLTENALETPKPGDPRFQAQTVTLVATPGQSLQAAAQAARAAGLAAHILADDLEGESREVAKVHAALARAVARGGGAFASPCVLLSGGETTVTLRRGGADGPIGRGGRNGEFCLALALALNGQPGVWALAADTDGIDGVADNAGAIVTPDTLARAQRQGLDLHDCLARHDAHAAFARLGDLLVTGPTYTNVNDFRALLILR